MALRITWMIPPGETVTIYHVQEAIKAFYDKHRIKPNIARLAVNDLDFVTRSSHLPPRILEKGKDYGLFVPSCCGPILMDMLEDGHEVIARSPSLTGNQSSIIIVESDQIDKDFEKILLEDKKDV